MVPGGPGFRDPQREGSARAPPSLARPRCGPGARIARASGAVSSDVQKERPRSSPPSATAASVACATASSGRSPPITPEWNVSSSWERSLPRRLACTVATAWTTLRQPVTLAEFDEHGPQSTWALMPMPGRKPARTAARARMLGCRSAFTAPGPCREANHPGAEPRPPGRARAR